MPFTVLLIWRTYSENSMWSSNTRANLSSAVLKITPPRKTPDTTTVSDGRPWHAERWTSMREELAPPPISKAEEPMARCTHRGYLRELISDPPHHPLPDHVPLCVLSSAWPPNPRARALALVPNAYRLPNSSAGHRRHVGLRNPGLRLYHIYTRHISALHKHWAPLVQNTNILNPFSAENQRLF